MVAYSAIFLIQLQMILKCGQMRNTCFKDAMCILLYKTPFLILFFLIKSKCLPKVKKSQHFFFSISG